MASEKTQLKASTTVIVTAVEGAAAVSAVNAKGLRRGCIVMNIAAIVYLLALAVTGFYYSEIICTLSSLHKSLTLQSRFSASLTCLDLRMPYGQH
jgi:hypothetical protein